jgi:hypothetical protein
MRTRHTTHAHLGIFLSALALLTAALPSWRLRTVLVDAVVARAVVIWCPWHPWRRRLSPLSQADASRAQTGLAQRLREPFPYLNPGRAQTGKTDGALQAPNARATASAASRHGIRLNLSSK